MPTLMLKKHQSLLLGRRAEDDRPGDGRDEKQGLLTVGTPCPIAEPESSYLPFFSLCSIRTEIASLPRVCKEWKEACQQTKHISVSS